MKILAFLVWMELPTFVNSVVEIPIGGQTEVDKPRIYYARQKCHLDGLVWTRQDIFRLIMYTGISADTKFFDACPPTDTRRIMADVSMSGYTLIIARTVADR